MEKYVFLNIDGVLTQSRNRKCFTNLPILNRRKTLLFSKFIKASNAKVILLSSENLFFETCMDNSLSEEFKKYGVEIESNIENILNSKGYAIFKFLEENSWESFVIFDNAENDYGKYGLDSHFIKINTKTGLKIEETFSALRILDCQKSYIVNKELVTEKTNFDA